MNNIKKLLQATFAGSTTNDSASFYQKSIKVFPGVLLCLVIMLLGAELAQWLGKAMLHLQGIEAGSSPVSGILVAIILGLLVRNFIGLHSFFKEGVTFSIKIILKAGIILLGIRLSIFDVLALGGWGLPIILVCVASGLIVTMWITERMNQSHRLGTLTAVGTGICGITAIVAIAPGIKTNDEEMAYAVANITLFGIVAMFVYPYVAHFFFHDNPVQAGFFLGTAIHETAQVAGAALIYDQLYDAQRVVDVATITKLTRNVLLIAVVPIMCYYYYKRSRQQLENKASAQDEDNRYQDGIVDVPRWYHFFPLFVLGFLGFAILRSIGDAGVTEQGLAFAIWTPEQWTTIWTSINNFSSHYLLGVAMAAVGLSTSFSVFKGLGIKPFYIGLVAALTVSLVALGMVYLLGSVMNM